MRRKSMTKKRKNIWIAAGTIIGCGLLCLDVHTKQHRHSPQQPDSHNGHTPPQTDAQIECTSRQTDPQIDRASRQTGPQGECLTPQAQEEIAALWHGTYQLGPFDEAEYIAVMPSSDPCSTDIQFQWYTIDDRILHEGACIPYESDRLRLFSDDTILAVLTCHDEQYYLTTGDQLTDSEMMTGDQQTDSATNSDTNLNDSKTDSDTNLNDSAVHAGNAPAAADGSSSPAQKLLKISPEPIVCQPVE